MAVLGMLNAELGSAKSAVAVSLLVFRYVYRADTDIFEPSDRSTEPVSSSMYGDSRFGSIRRSAGRLSDTSVPNSVG